MYICDVQFYIMTNKSGVNRMKETEIDYNKLNGKEIKGYKFYYEYPGVCTFYGEKYTILATPFWEDENKIQIDIEDNEHNPIEGENHLIDFSSTSTLEDYVNFMEKFIEESKIL